MNIKTGFRVLGAISAALPIAAGLAFGIGPAVPAEPTGPPACVPAVEVPTGHDNLVDINSAPRDWLVWLGFDESLASKIIANRPYQARKDLLNKGILSRPAYETVKDRIIARHV